MKSQDIRFFLWNKQADIKDPQFLFYETLRRILHITIYMYCSQVFFYLYKLVLIRKYWLLASLSQSKSNRNMIIICQKLLPLNWNQEFYSWNMRKCKFQVYLQSSPWISNRRIFHRSLFYRSYANTCFDLKSIQL